MKQKSTFTVFYSGILAGIIIGILLWNILLAGKLDNLYKRNRYLESMAEDYRIRLEKLEQTQPEKEQTLKEIMVEISIEDVLERMILEKAVKQKYDNLLGKKISEIDLDLVIEVVDKRIFQTEQYQYQLTVERVVLSSDLLICLSARETTPPD